MARALGLSEQPRLDLKPTIKRHQIRIRVNNDRTFDKEHVIDRVTSATFTNRTYLTLDSADIDFLLACPSRRT